VTKGKCGEAQASAVCWRSVLAGVMRRWYSKLIMHLNFHK